jgi:hypothetical protein
VEEPADVAVAVTEDAVEFAMFQPRIELWCCCISEDREHEPHRCGLRRILVTLVAL